MMNMISTRWDGRKYILAHAEQGHRRGGKDTLLAYCGWSMSERGRVERNYNVMKNIECFLFTHLSLLEPSKWNE